jgi:hypothetical protein
MYVQKDTYKYKHHTDMFVFDTYMSVCNTDNTECACICLNVYVCDSPRNSIVFVLNLYDVCILGLDTSSYIHVCICMYLVCIFHVFCMYPVCIILYLACIFLLRAVFFSLIRSQISEC